jgi:glutaredoxin
MGQHDASDAARAGARRARTRPRELVLYARARCGMCRAAERRVRRELRLTVPWRRPSVRLVDVDADPEREGLAERYGVRVPVVVLDGVELSELELAAGVVRRALRGWPRDRGSGR